VSVPEFPDPSIPLAAEVELEAPATTILLWDLPVRIVHWSFVLLLPALWWSWQAGLMEVHRLLGYAALALMLFRLYWGFAGSDTARFASFVKGPRAVARYLAGRAGEPVLGHNPLGALSVVALLFLLALQIGLGLVAQDVDGLFAGPLAHWVDYETSELARAWHGTIFYVLLGFVGLHLAAILFYLLVRRTNLVGPMVTGRKRVPSCVAPSEPAPWRRALMGAAFSLAVTVWIAAGAPFPSVD
jgi:cytochrome b